MAKKYWKTIVFSSIANKPNTQVRPSRGSNTIIPFTPALWTEGKMLYVSIYKVGDVGISSDPIGPLFLANGQCPHVSSVGEYSAIIHCH